jgi:hypothetical protein
MTSELLNHMMSRFGPTLGGQDLYSALGFKTYGAFHRRRQLSEVGVHIFKLPGRRGWFARTDEVARWLEEQSGKSSIEEARP